MKINDDVLWRWEPPYDDGTHRKEGMLSHAMTDELAEMNTPLMEWLWKIQFTGNHTIHHRLTTDKKGHLLTFITGLSWNIIYPVMDSIRYGPR
jgi:hypothetical protein